MKTIVSGFNSTDFYWRCPPGSPDKGWTLENSVITIRADSQRDYWRNTYYEPLLIKDDGPCYLTKIDANQDFTTQVTMTLKPKKQFDQGGLFLRVNFEHWVKAGIEFVDGIPRLSCVVTNKFSDWSTQIYHTTGDDISIHLRLTKKGNAIIMESADVQTEKWEFVRISYLGLSSPSQLPHEFLGKIQVGVFACCPIEQAGAVATFSNFSISEGTNFHHTSDGS